MNKDWIEVELENLLDYLQPTKYIVSSTKYNDSYRTPVLTAGKSFIKGYTDETDNVFKDLPVIIFDDFTTATQFVNFQFKVKSSAMKILVPTSELVNMKYVFYFMQTIREITDTHKRYWISMFSKLPIPLAPLPEQRAIVAKIEQLFSELDNGIANLKTAQQKLTLYKQAVLKKAFEGGFTEEWRKKQGVKDDKNGLPTGWKINNLKDIISRISDGPFGSNLKSSDYVDDGVRVIRLENIGELEFRDEYKTFVTDEKYETLSRYEVYSGDIIFSSFITENIRTVILPDYVKKAINKADCFLVRSDDNKVLKKYLVYFFSSRNMYNQFASQVHGATRPRINTTQLKEALIPVAPSLEQDQIVQEIESRLSVCDKVQETISQNLAKVEALRQSILKKAFSGNLLTEKELSACRNAADYAPASELIKEIVN